MKAEKEKGLKIAFVVDERSLQRLDKIARDAGAEPEYALFCSDGSTLKPDSLGDLVGFPNTDKRRIIRVSLSTSYRSYPRIQVKLGGESQFLGSVSYNVAGEDKDVVYLVEKIEEWIMSVRQPYSRFAFSTEWTIGLVGALTVVGLALQVLSNFTQRLGWSKSLDPVLFLSGLFLFSLSWWVGRLRRWLFPISIFGIGGGVKELEDVRARQKRFGILSVIGFCATVLISIFGSVIANRLTK